MEFHHELIKSFKIRNNIKYNLIYLLIYVQVWNPLRLHRELMNIPS